jgi:hypothetical protein
MVPYRSNYINKGGAALMFCKLGDKGQAVEALQHLIIDAGGSLPQWGADGDFGNETKAGLAALVGGDGSIYGPSQYSDLMVRLAKRYGGAAPAPDLTALTARVAAVEAGVKAVAGDLAALATVVGSTLATRVNAAIAETLAKVRLILPPGM